MFNYQKNLAALKQGREFVKNETKWWWQKNKGFLQLNCSACKKLVI